MRKRNHVIPLHLNAKELGYLEKQVKTKRPAPRGIPAFPHYGNGAAGKALHSITRICSDKTAGLCNNANQLARIANTYGEADQQSIEEMIRLARQIWKEVKNNW